MLSGCTTLDKETRMDKYEKSEFTEPSGNEFGVWSDKEPADE